MSRGPRHARSVSAAPRITAGAVALLCALLAGLLAHAARDAEAQPAPRPNIIVIMTDDQALSSFRERYMPNTFRELGGEGTEFTDAVVATPLCCPSRATLLTGQYGHNNGVLRNSYGLLEDNSNVLPTWLRRSGYRTAHVGKFLNGYHAAVGDPLEVAPGWDAWFTTLGSTRYFNYDVSANGRRKHFGNGRRHHVTRVINRKAGTLIRRFTPSTKPLYLQIDHRAPHTETNVNSGGNCGLRAIPEKNRDRKRLRDEELPEPSSFNETDVLDKPSFIRNRSPLGKRKIKKIERRFKCAAASLRSVDRGVKRIVNALENAHQLESTVIVFTSDHGFFYGEHRIARDKTIPYEEAIRVPLVIRAPAHYLGGAAVPVVEQQVANIDLAPTLLELAGAEPCESDGECRVVDGRSLLPLLRGGSGWPADRGVLLEYDGAGSKGNSSCKYEGIRAAGWVYVEHQALPDPVSDDCREVDERELYDLTRDPFELFNQIAVNQPIVDALEDRLDRLRGCSGIRGGPPPDPLDASRCE